MTRNGAPFQGAAGEASIASPASSLQVSGGSSACFSAGAWWCDSGLRRTLRSQGRGGNAKAPPAISSDASAAAALNWRAGNKRAPSPVPRARLKIPRKRGAPNGNLGIEPGHELLPPLKGRQARRKPESAAKTETNVDPRPFAGVHGRRQREAQTRQAPALPRRGYRPEFAEHFSPKGERRAERRKTYGVREPSTDPRRAPRGAPQAAFSLLRRAALFV